MLKALKAHDDLLDNQLDKLRTNLGSDKGRVSDRIDKVIFDFPRNIPMDFASKLTTRLVEAVTVSWWYWYGLLEKYTAENNGAIPLAHYKTPSGDKLGRWCIKQRTLRYSMPRERLEHLEKIPSWVWDVADAEWDANYNKLLAFRKLNGSFFSIKQYPDKKVGRWAKRQRNSYLSGELSPDRISLLEKIPNWIWSSEARWENQFNAFLEVVEKEGTSLLTVDFLTDNGDQIGTWIDTQRQNKDQLSEKQIAKLENLPDWSWHPNKDRWFEGFNNLKEYCDAHGTSLVLQSYKTSDGYPLGRWLNTQRRNFQRLDEEFQSLLRNLPDWCIDAREYKWQKTFELFEKYAQDLDDPNISRATKGPYPQINIGSWVETQKERHRSNLLPKNKIQKLEKIKGWKWRV